MTEPIILAAGLTGVTAAGVAQATGVADPWWVAAIVIPLGAFAAWLVRWILQKQDERDKTMAAIQAAREQREDKRAEHVELQTQAMQECVTELRLLRDGQEHQARAIERLETTNTRLADSVTVLVKKGDSQRGGK